MLMVTVRRHFGGCVPTQLVVPCDLLRCEYVDRGKVILQMRRAERRLRRPDLLRAALQARECNRAVGKAIV